MLNPAILPARGGGGRVKLTPAQQQALARAIGSVVRYLVRTGYGWWLLAGLGLSALGCTAWILDWWTPVRRWLGH